MLPLFVGFFLVGKVIGGHKLGWVIVILTGCQVVGRGWVIGLFLWLLEFQQTKQNGTE